MRLTAGLPPLNRSVAKAGREGTRGHFTGYLELEDRDYTGKQPVNEFRGWVWQSGTCLDATDETDGCQKEAFFSLRLPIEVLSRALLQGKRPPRPPPDLDQFQVRIEVLPPRRRASPVR